jgi:hypothetical protein
MYDNPHVKPQNQFHWQRNFESMQSKRDSCRSSKGVIHEDAKRTVLPRATRTANTLAANIGTDVRVIIACCQTQAMAQRKEAGKEIAKDLLRALIESQLERQGRESFGPGRPVPPVIGEIPRPTQATPEMLQIRRILASMAQDANALSASGVGRGTPEPGFAAADS